MTSPLTPHSGYHWRGQSTRFFEGWYFRLTLPDIAQSFAFMYSIDDPAGGQLHSGGAVQILGPDEAYYCRTFPEVRKFWARSHTLAFGHHRSANLQTTNLKQAGPFTPKDFTQTITEGYQIQNHRHQGRLLTPAGEVQAEWDFTIIPQVSWGDPMSKQPLAGSLTYLCLSPAGRCSWPTATLQAGSFGRAPTTPLTMLLPMQKKTGAVLSPPSGYGYSAMPFPPRRI